MPMNVREVIRLLEREGCVEMRPKGSHRHFKNLEQPFVITAPGNEGKELAPGTLNEILKKAGLEMSDAIPSSSSKQVPASPRTPRMSLAVQPPAIRKRRLDATFKMRSRPTLS